MTKLRQTLTVIGPHGSEVTVLKPGLGKVIVIAHSGATASAACAFITRRCDETAVIWGE